MHNQMFTLVPYFILTVWILLLAMIVFVLISNWRRGRKVEAYAGSRGWRYTKNGKRALARYPETHPFPLSFGCRVRHLVEFSRDGFEVESFEYSYSEGGKNKRRVYVHATSITIPHHAPFLQIRPEQRVDSVRKLFGARDTQFESGHFNDEWLVRGDDEKFTHGVVHPQMMTWLMKHPGRNFTLSADLLFGYAYQPFDPAEIVPRAELLMSFYRNIPGFVWQEPSARGQQQGAAP